MLAPLLRTRPGTSERIVLGPNTLVRRTAETVIHGPVRRSTQVLLFVASQDQMRAYIRFCWREPMTPSPDGIRAPRPH